MAAIRWLARNPTTDGAGGHYVLSVHKPRPLDTNGHTGWTVLHAVGAPTRVDLVTPALWHAMDGPRLRPGAGPVEVCIFLLTMDADVYRRAQKRATTRAAARRARPVRQGAARRR